MILDYQFLSKSQELELEEEKQLRKNAEEARQIVLKAIQIEKAGILAWQQFQNEQLKGLLSAIKAAKNLKKLLVSLTSLNQYPATSPIFYS